MEPFPSPAGRPRRRRPAARLLAAFLGFALLLLGVLASPAQAALSAPPSTPGSFTTSSVTSSSVKLSWTASTDNLGVLGYRVYRALGSGPLTVITTTDAGVLTFTASNLRSKSAYTFAVAAIDADNQEARTATKTVTTTSSTDTTAPTAVSGTTFSLKAFSATRIDMVWSASSSSDVAYYEVLRGGTVVATVDRPLSTKYSDNGLTAATTYSYAVRAVDSAGNRSAATTAKSGKTLAAGAVQIPRGPYALKVNSTSAVIAWWTNVAATGSVAVTGGPTATGPSATFHTVTVNGLTAGTQYAYRVASGAASATGSFRTAAPAGKPFTFAAIGDFGGASAQEGQNATRIAAYGSDFLQTVGDNVYPSSGFPDPDFATQYSDLDARIFKQFGSVLSTQGFFPANGNKEYYGNKQFWNAFPSPSTTNSYYSYDWGDAHFLVLDPFQPYTSGSAQYSFASSDLAAHQNAAWRIVIEHLPPYSSTNATSGNVGIKNNLVPLFQAQHVDLVLSGDTHNYQRSKPLINGAPVTSGGVTYVVTGGGGNGLNSFTTASMPTWQAARAAVYETLKVQVSPTSLQLNAVGADGSAVDSATLTKGGATDTTAPTTPGTPTATAGSTSVALSWTASTDNVGVDHYNVFRDGAATAVGTPTTNSYTDTGLASGSTHTYTVSAVDAAGNQSAQSGSVSVTTTTTGDTTPPSAPTGLTATPGSTTVQLSWAANQAADGVTSYRVYRGGTNVGSSTTNSYTDTGLTPSTAYGYTVTAVDAAGNESAKSAAANTTTTSGSGGASTVTLTPTDDRTIDPAATSPNNLRLKVDNSAPVNDLLLKFTVPSSCTSITAAHLQLTVGTDTNDPSAKGGDFYATSATDANAGWSEATVVWGTAPAKTGSPVTLAGAVAANTMYDVTVTSLVPSAGGTFTIRGSSTSGDGAGYFSKEGSATSAPKLVLTCGG